MLRGGPPGPSLRTVFAWLVCLLVLAPGQTQGPCSFETVTVIQEVMGNVKKMNSLDSRLYTPTLEDYQQKCPSSTLNCFAKEANVLHLEWDNMATFPTVTNRTTLPRTTNRTTLPRTTSRTTLPIKPPRTTLLRTIKGPALPRMNRTTLPRTTNRATLPRTTNRATLPRTTNRATLPRRLQVRLEKLAILVKQKAEEGCRQCEAHTESSAEVFLTSVLQVVQRMNSDYCVRATTVAAAT
ncbi:interleukin 15, like [Polymixia lowei]